jgi:hypothetical protein
VKLPKLLRGAPPAPGSMPRRRRRVRRADAPRTIVPVLDDPAPAAGTSFALNVDAARERLRRDIAPVSDDEQ